MPMGSCHYHNLTLQHLGGSSAGWDLIRFDMIQAASVHVYNMKQAAYRGFYVLTKAALVHSFAMMLTGGACTRSSSEVCCEQYGAAASLASLHLRL